MSVLLEREAEGLQQRPTLVVVGRGGHDRDVHAAAAVDPVLVDLVEHDLLGEAEGVVSLAVELPRREAAEVADPGQGQRQQAVEELPHAVAAQRGVCADRHPLAQLELRDGLAGLGDQRLLAGDRGEVLDGALDQLGVASGLAHTHVDHDLDQAGDLHRVGDVEPRPQRRDDLVAVALLEARGHRSRRRRTRGLRRRLGRLDLGLGCGVAHQMSLPVLREMRTLRSAAYVDPSGRRLVTLSRRKPTRVTPLPSTRITLETWIGASEVMIPPVVPARPPWLTTLVCRLTRLTPSTITRCSSRSTPMTLPSAPLSRPAITLTVSPFLMLTDFFAMAQSTSGASEMIFMNFFSRSSRPTGPKMRVPRGSPSLLRMTAAFSSKRMYEPSGRRRSLTVRTMTALTTSPFFTLPPGIASFTVATMTSPIPA